MFGVRVRCAYPGRRSADMGGPKIGNALPMRARRPVRNCRWVDRAEALQALPPSYGVALRLQDEGVEPDAVARVLDVDLEAVGPLLSLARGEVGAGGRPSCPPVPGPAAGMHFSAPSMTRARVDDHLPGHLTTARYGKGGIRVRAHT
jgi:hypothetical protein